MHSTTQGPWHIYLPIPIEHHPGGESLPWQRNQFKAEMAGAFSKTLASSASLSRLAHRGNGSSWPRLRDCGLVFGELQVSV